MRRRRRRAIYPRRVRPQPAQLVKLADLHDARGRRKRACGRVRGSARRRESVIEWPLTAAASLTQKLENPRAARRSLRRFSPLAPFLGVPSFRSSQSRPSRPLWPRRRSCAPASHQAARFAPRARASARGARGRVPNRLVSRARDATRTPDPTRRRAHARPSLPRRRRRPRARAPERSCRRPSWASRSPWATSTPCS